MENEWLQKLAEWACMNPLVSNLYVFGSRVKGTHQETSDLDVAILLHGKDQVERILNWNDHAEQWKQEHNKLFPNGPEIDLQPIGDDDEIVAPSVAEYGQEIYSATKCG